MWKTMCITCENYVYRVYKYTQYLHNLLLRLLHGGGEVLFIQSLYLRYSHLCAHTKRSIFRLFRGKNIGYPTYPHSLILLLLNNTNKYDKIENI